LDALSVVWSLNEDGFSFVVGDFLDVVAGWKYESEVEGGVVENTAGSGNVGVVQECEREEERCGERGKKNST
jgi:hypothetical protein